VEVSSFLSGGIDSSLVTAVTSRYMANIQTYTIGFQQEKYDESIYAKEVAKALNIRNKTKIVEEKDFLNYVKYLPEVYDEPLADNSCIPTMILCQFAAQDVKVALSSDGGDEAYFGYRKFAFIKNLREKFSRKWLRKLVVITLSMLLPIAKLLDGFYYNFYSRVVKLRDIFNADNAVDALKAYETIYTPLEISKLIKRKFKKEESQISRNNSDHDIAAMLPYTYQYYLPSILAKVDRASMYFSLEVRDPMLDKDFVEFSARIPFHLKYHEKESKVLLKRYLSEFISRTIFERPKKGFNIPVYEWMKGQLNAEWKELLRNARWDELGIKAPQEIFNLDKKLSQGKAINADKLWNIYVLLKWHKHWHHEG
ncbi:MAG: asparagine synthase C-terminal domain-containing protein, partial [Fulvivirga sp.]